ncbi:NAD-dependent epimerase/dehydratase family protein [uncultured Campylobacter sp.]|uniref:NAD-dependent epimerase/dehydratase family protein n=1 Tax=uncultured Campylobacter sp. TaxID=218934 RepID=UPI002636A078|nr:NAD-dependent epimerase/dehydratase family protein [uncultured Campylobacter sp.]
MGKSALVLGATGVVGRELVRELCESPGYDEVEAWAHRQTDFCHFKLCVRIIDFEGISDIAPHKFDEIFCALGTTMKQAGSREAFLRVDVDYVYVAAKWGKAAGVRRFVLVSAPGGSEGSPSFYLRAKGQIERRVSKLGFDSLQIVRPPTILGERSDTRLLERLAAAVFKLLPACVFGKFRPLSGASSVRCERNFWLQIL